MDYRQLLSCKIVILIAILVLNLSYVLGSRIESGKTVNVAGGEIDDHTRNKPLQENIEETFFVPKAHHDVSYSRHKRQSTFTNTSNTPPSTIESSCPTWFLPSNSSKYPCTCTGLQDIVECDNVTMETMLSVNYCMTYDENTGEVSVGSCPYNFYRVSLNTLSVSLPINSSDLNEFICGSLNREGPLCGRCKSGFGLSPTSEHVNCSVCTEDTNVCGWYLLTDFMFQTIFFLVLVVFKISVTSPALNAYILYSQIVSFTYIRPLATAVLKSHDVSFLYEFAQTAIAAYNIWALNFFTLVIPPTCLDENLTQLSAIALQYVSAFYPLLLILILYGCIKLRDSNFKLFVWAWRPLHKCRVGIKRYYDLQQPTAQAFATVFLLSYVKVASVSYSLLVPSIMYGADGKRKGKAAWYYDASVTLFEGDHIYYGILALTIFGTYILIPPFLLFFYPFKWFQKFLNKVRLGRSGLSIFMDILQSHYNNGLNGTRDLRSFSAVYFWIRIVFLFVRLGFFFRSVNYDIESILFVVSAIIVIAIRPYKKYIYNVIDCLFLCLLAVLFHIYFLLDLYSFIVPLFLVFIVLGVLPMLYFAVYVIHHLFVAIRVPKKWKKFAKREWNELKKKFRRVDNTEMNELAHVDDSELPHRHLRPDLYNGLLKNDGLLAATI